jgi:hypothetical protein
MRVALRQQAEMRPGEPEPEGADRRLHERRAALHQRLGAEIAEMVVQPRPPGQGQRVAGLQERPHAPRAPALDEPEMPPVARRQHLEDHIGLAVPARSDDDSVFRPFHEGLLQDGKTRRDPQPGNNRPRGRLPAKAKRG